MASKGYDPIRIIGPAPAHVPHRFYLVTRPALLMQAPDSCYQRWRLIFVKQIQH